MNLSFYWVVLVVVTTMTTTMTTMTTTMTNGGLFPRMMMMMVSAQEQPPQEVQVQDKEEEDETLQQQQQQQQQQQEQKDHPRKTTEEEEEETTTTEEEEMEDAASMDDLIVPLLEWFRDDKGGFFHEALTIRRAVPTDASSPFGMYVTSDVDMDTILLKIPRGALITAEGPYYNYDDAARAAEMKEDYPDYGALWCPTIENIMREIVLEMEESDPPPPQQQEQDDDDDDDIHQDIQENQDDNDNNNNNTKKGSEWGPYVRYLAAQPRGALPSAWSIAGQDLLLVLLGQAVDRNDQDIPRPKTTSDGNNNNNYENLEMKLPPAEPIDWIREEWRKECRGSDDAFAESVALLLIQRGWDDLAIPVYDMMSHRNGWYHNTKSTSVHDRKEPFIVVRAARPLSAGEELYTSYNFCTDCGGKARGYGTPEILRDYGFVEDYPQRWFFRHRIGFELDEPKDQDGLPITGVEPQLRWLEKRKPTPAAIPFLQQQWTRLREFQRIDLAQPDPSIPPHELRTMTQYLHAVQNAIRMALKHLEPPSKPGESPRRRNSTDLKKNADETTTIVVLDDDDDDNDVVKVCGDDDGGGEDGPSESSSSSCVSPAGRLSSRYDALEYRRERDNKYAVYTCDTDVSMNMDAFERLEMFKSPYQKVEFNKDPKNDNVCFEISNIIQICGSYRPQYHEMVVHYPARFIPHPIRRVLWVGGGDSMLLHEILKYRHLEIVVGLELDQTITRYSFKHFGSQPHFDNPKVQWWYGDAAKSLLLLPEEYFASFDLVLVDLSETVMSALVTDQLDIMQALSLLLREDGIMVKNELYMEQMSDIFDYTIQIHYNWVPVICSQCLILGSNKIDFLYSDRTDHELVSENLYIRPVDDIGDHLEYFHDYRRNTTAQHLCRDHNDPADDDEDDMKKQTRSPGILMIIEAEHAAVDLTDTDGVVEAVLKALESEAGLKLVSSKTSSSRTVSVGGGGVGGNGGGTNTAIITLIFQHGYVVLRTFPERNYCAVDLHMWRKFDEQNAAKVAIVRALGVPETTKRPDAFGGSRELYSSYRIVAGGVFGLPTWKADESNRGPRIVDSCRDNESRKKAGELPRSASSSPSPSAATERLDDERRVRIATAFLEEGLSIIPKEEEDVGGGGEEEEGRRPGWIAVVICGERRTDEGSSCGTSLDVLRANADFGKVIPLWTCPGLGSPRAEFEPDAYERFVQCERDLAETLVEQVSLELDEAVRAIIVDVDAPYATARMAYNIFKTRKQRLFLHNEVFLWAVLFEEGHEWRRNLLERFRRAEEEPVFRSEIIFRDAALMAAASASADGHDGDGDGDDDANEGPRLPPVLCELDMTSSGDPGFVHRLVHDVVPSMEARTALAADVRDLQGGMFVEDPDWEWGRFYLPEDYDQTDPLSQWMSQQPRGYQTVFQLETTKHLKEPLTMESIHDALVVAQKKATKIMKDDDESDSGDDDDDDESDRLPLVPVGDGGVIVLNWPGDGGGNAVVLWDGRDHVDLNIFTYRESRTLADTVLAVFTGEFRPSRKSFRVALRDVQPRGNGRVVNFLKDLVEDNTRDTVEEEDEAGGGGGGGDKKKKRRRVIEADFLSEEQQEKARDTSGRMKPHWAKFKKDVDDDEEEEESSSSS